MEPHITRRFASTKLEIEVVRVSTGLGKGPLGVVRKPEAVGGGSKGL